MALPIINETINYIKVKLPSGKTIGIRGWKVKEEKELLFASEKITEENPNVLKKYLVLMKINLNSKKT